MAALKAKQYLNGLASLKVDQVERLDFVRVRLAVGDTAIQAGGKKVSLPVAVQRDDDGAVWFPAKPLAEALGGRVESNRFWFGHWWVDADPANQRVTSSVYRAPSYPIIKLVNG